MSANPAVYWNSLVKLSSNNSNAFKPLQAQKNKRFIITFKIFWFQMLANTLGHDCSYLPYSTMYDILFMKTVMNSGGWKERERKKKLLTGGGGEKFEGNLERMLAR